jgi:hypothetical protein
MLTWTGILTPRFSPYNVNILEPAHVQGTDA